MFEEPAFSELARHYEATYLARQRDGTRKTRASMLRAALAHFNAKEITHPRTADWVRYLADRVIAGSLMRSTANQHRKVMSHVYRWCRDVPDRPAWRLLADPFAHGAIPKWEEPEPAPRAMRNHLATFPALLAAARDPLERAWFSLLRRHGLREGEGLGIEPGDIDWNAGTVRIQRQRKPTTVAPSRLKTDVSAAVLVFHPETARLVREATRWRMEGGRRAEVKAARAFTGEAGRRYIFPYFAAALSDSIEVCRRASPDDFPRRIVGVDGGEGWHVFRHTYAVALVEAGIKTERIHQLLRHRNLATTDAYLRALTGRHAGDPEELHRVWAEEAERERAAVDLARPGLKVVRGSGQHD